MFSVQERSEDEDAPEPDHDAGHSREHLDQGSDYPTNRMRSEASQKETDRDRERSREDERPRRRSQRPDDELTGAERLVSGFQVWSQMNEIPNVPDRRPGASRRSLSR